MKGLQVGLAAAVVAWGILSVGCAGPTTRVLPMAGSGGVQETPEEIPVLEEVNPFYLQESLEILTENPRPSGSREESDAARYIEQLLSGYGYQVDRQRFRDEEPERTVTGSNVEAVREAPAPDADILILCTHHDTAPGSPGAGDNASGVATLLETARLLSKIPTDTELRFVSFSGHEQGLLGSRRYVSALSRREKERIIGMIDLDQIGYVSGTEIVLKTLDGEETMLGSMLKASARDVLGEGWSCQTGEGGDASSFVRGQIPAVTVGQAVRSYEDKTPYDQAEVVDIERVSQVVDVLCQAVSQIVSSDTPSMTAKAHAANDLRNPAFVQTKDTLIYFGDSLEHTEDQVGQEGVLAGEQVNPDQSVVRTYDFLMEWFGVEQKILTSYYVRDGRLESVSLDGDGAGITFEEMHSRIQEMYGAGRETGEGPYGKEYVWEDPLCRRRFRLTPESDGYQVDVEPMEAEMQVLEKWSMDGALLEQTHGDERSAQVMEFVRAMLPERAAQRMDSIVVYTDGIGGSRGYLRRTDPTSQDPANQDPANQDPSGQEPPAQDSAGPAWELGLDLEDAVLENGAWRDETETVQLLVGLCGQLLEEDPGSDYASLFALQFSSDQAEAVGPADKNSLPAPGFQDSFSLFVLSGIQESHRPDWDRRLAFFGQFEELRQYRAQVRELLGLHTEETRFE